MTELELALRASLQDISDAYQDFLKTPFQNAINALGRIVYLLDEEPMASFLAAALPKADFKAWWNQTNSSMGPMAGSLDWPHVRAERVALQVSLCRALATCEIQFPEFTMRFCRSRSTQLNALVLEFTRTILEPMIRDIKRLTEVRAVPPILAEALALLPESGDTVLDSMLREACQKFRDPAPVSRRAAVEKLWDAWERLKTLDDASDKKLSVEALLDNAADDPTFRAVLEAEARALTDIGNSFHIRHFEADRAAIHHAVHFDYLFHRLYALIHLLLLKRERRT